MVHSTVVHADISSYCTMHLGLQKTNTLNGERHNMNVLEANVQKSNV
jgi:hypothetical protein